MRWNNLIVSAFLRMRLCLWLRFVSRSMGLFAGSARLPVLDPPVFPFLLHSLVLSCLSDDRSVRRSVRLSACACLLSFAIRKVSLCCLPFWPSSSPVFTNPSSMSMLPPRRSLPRLPGGWLRFVSRSMGLVAFVVCTHWSLQRVPDLDTSSRCSVG